MPLVDSLLNQSTAVNKLELVIYTLRRLDTNIVSCLQRASTVTVCRSPVYRMISEIEIEFKELFPKQQQGLFHYK